MISVAAAALMFPEPGTMYSTIDGGRFRGLDRVQQAAFVDNLVRAALTGLQSFDSRF